MDDGVKTTVTTLRVADCTIGPVRRVRAIGVLDRWLDRCEREASDVFENGRSGYLGRLKLCAFADPDGGVSLRLEHGFSEEP